MRIEIENESTILGGTNVLASLTEGGTLFSLDFLHLLLHKVGSGV